ncbi:hypothetical protein PPERSA_04995 [Pseudocohnilembus persalinus]|uniref:Uncharacterized protein n=1 Tax=Pseudocohnilembus persalinus TaxID=266149 RepID=A0A0V0QVZ0_PSEPJ|nr:hypothetical protein PPERSA_04995 [Pseudocohnilembus persalinus]|eukprot:KRX06382.1 hypothetical protein PPERSA_04995 [Pseudocohnilembus persalinus]
MSAGTKVIINDTAVVGNIGVQRDWKIFKVQKDNENLDSFDYDEQSYEYQYDIMSGLNSKNEIKWANKIFESFNSKIVDEVAQNRTIQGNNWVMNKIIIGQNAVDLALADQIGNYQDFLKKEHPQCRILCHETKSKFEAFVEKVHKYAILMKSINSSDHNINKQQSIKPSNSAVFSLKLIE